MNERKWKRLLRDIEEQRCVLMLGPRLGGLERDGKWRPILEEFSCHLTKELEAENIEYDAHCERRLPYVAELFLRIKGVERIDLEDEVRDFFKVNTLEIPPIYKTLATIPFSIVINTTFDDYMVRAFNNRGKLCFPHYYNFKRRTDDEINPEGINPQHPLVYNLFGTLGKPESLVITDVDQLEFVRNVVRGDPGIPEEVLEQFDHSKSYLFLGFDLEHWQFRLLLESLNLKEGNATHSPRTENYPISIATRSIFEGRFKFHFIDKDVDSFIEELVEKIDPAPAREKLPARTLYLAYVDRDKGFADQLGNFLQPLIQKGEISLQTKEQIPFGTDAVAATASMMQNADVILLMISADFLANPGINDREIKWALDQHDSRKASVIPIINRACDWKAHSRLSLLAPLPLNGEPINSGDWDTPDDAYLHVVKFLKKRIWG